MTRARTGATSRTSSRSASSSTSTTTWPRRSMSSAPCRTTGASAASSTCQGPGQDPRRRLRGDARRRGLEPRHRPERSQYRLFGGLLRNDHEDRPAARPAAGTRRARSSCRRPYENEPRLRGQWLAPFILSPHNPNIVYHGMQYVFRSLDRGDTWERISPDLTYNTAPKRAISPTIRSSPSPNPRSSTA